MPKKTPPPPVAPSQEHPIAEAIGRALGTIAKKAGLVHAEPPAPKPTPPTKKQRATTKKTTKKAARKKPAAKKQTAKKTATKKKSAKSAKKQ